MTLCQSKERTAPSCESVVCLMCFDLHIRWGGCNMPTRKFPSFQVFLNCAGIVYRTYEPKAQVQMEYIVIYAMINHTVYIFSPPPHVSMNLPQRKVRLLEAPSRLQWLEALGGHRSYIGYIDICSASSYSSAHKHT